MWKLYDHSWQKVLTILTMLLTGLFTANERVYAQREPDLEITRIIDFSNKEPDSSFTQLKILYARALEEKDKTAAGTALQQMGQICFHMGHYSQSLDFHLQASALFRAAGNMEHFAANLNDVGTLYYYNKQIPEARQQFEMALEIFKNYPSNPGQAITYGNIGHLYEKGQLYDSAFYFQHKALRLYQASDNKAGIAGIYENMGSIFEDLAKYDSSDYYYKAAFALYKQGNDSISTIEILNNLGDVLRKTGKYEASLAYTREAVRQSLNINETYQLSASYRDMAKAWHLMNRDDSAFLYQELSRKSLLDIYSRENNKQIAFLQVLNDIGKKNSEIEKLKTGRRNTMIITICAVIVILLLVVLGAVTISRQRLKIKNERLLRERSDQMHTARNELMAIDLTNKQLHEDVLQQNLEMKARELSTHTLLIIQKNQLLGELHATLEKMVKEDKRDQKKQLQQLIQQIDINFNQDQHWEEFRNIFEQVHESFFDKVRKICTDLTQNDLRLVALLKMNISSSDMATLLGISPDSLRVTRYRLRKKFNLEKGENLSSFIQSIS